MLSGEKILITGATGQIALPMAEYFSRENEVWGIARFTEEGSRRHLEALGVTTRVCDLGTNDFGDLPTDFTYLLHLAAFQGPEQDDDRAFWVNGEGTGFVLEHCRNARAALVMSSSSVYRPHDDPAHAFTETDPLGGARTPWAPTYAESKLAGEAVARFCARSLRLPVVIARMNASFGLNGGLPTQHVDAIMAGHDVVTRADPCPYSPIFQEDINEQAEALLAAAGVPATIVNWGGDEPVSVQEWCAYVGDLTGTSPAVTVQQAPGAHVGMVSDRTKRAALTGPCLVGWREGLRRVVESRNAQRSEPTI